MAIAISTQQHQQTNYSSCWHSFSGNAWLVCLKAKIKFIDGSRQPINCKLFDNHFSGKEIYLVECKSTVMFYCCWSLVSIHVVFFYSQNAHAGFERHDKWQSLWKLSLWKVGSNDSGLTNQSTKFKVRLLHSH